ncbi:Speckle targeted PIP5K1A-regulated poly(A) polymerase [Orchesella cincta]|uniref:Speckle targeted PIP5K1A-regulated poly(A) polymerase n=1 Tax=Orchesella cincta TaxID=48709 RepID=A0A1D2N7Q0_ORCCI|nr:Speckle targeted PIP5K1A-regulated poly(A) polymerase [Orchesella cincta]
MSSYSDWLKHLRDWKHQQELRKCYTPRSQWPNHENSYVLSGPMNEFSFAKLLEWVATFGVVTEFMHDTKNNFCIFTLQSVGDIGKAKVEEVIGEQVVFGKKVVMKPKSEFGPFEWNLIYEAGKRAEGDFDNKSVASTTSSSSVNSSRRSLKDVTPTPKGTLVFTNRNLSSKPDNVKSPSAKSLKPGNTMKAEMDNIEGAIRKLMVNDSSHHEMPGSQTKEQSSENSKEKGRKKKKSKQKNSTAIDLEILPKNEESVGTYSSVLKSSVQLIQSDDKSGPVLQSQSTEVNNTDGGSSTSQEPLNFRGGFTFLRTLKVSESNDGNYQEQQGDDEAANRPSTDKTSMVSSANSEKPSFRNKEQSLVEPLKQILEAHLVKATSQQRLGTNGNDSIPKSRAIDGSKNRPTAKLIKRKIETAPQSSLNLKFNINPFPLNQDLNATVPRHVNHFLGTISPTFAAQVPDVVKNYLVHPAYPTGNTYRFSGHPPLASFFELFEFLGMPSGMKPKKQKIPTQELYRRFSSLQLTMQLQEFLAAQTLSSEELILRWQFMLDMLYILRGHYPKCELYAFGSILTGLGDFSSDIDVYVDLTGESSSPSRDASKKLTSQQALELAKRILSKSLCPHLKTRFVKNVIAIRSARIPIIKLTHAVTFVNCDISFENRLSVQNSKLMTLCIKLDPRVFPLMVLIRFWGKFHQITGSSLIKNYALMLLVLVYLVKAQVLPPITLLQKLKAMERQRNGQAENPDEIEGWNASFCENLEMIKSHFKGSTIQPSYAQNPAPTLIKMAQEFFELYGNIDFSKVVVCTLLGEILPKEDFLPGNEERLHEGLDLYKIWAMQQDRNKRLNVKNALLCIQDPFLLSFNVGCVTPHPTLVRFQIGCLKAAQVLRNTNNLKSILDVLVPIPSHIGERKFIRVYKIIRKSEELKKEIKLAFGTNPGDKRKSSAAQPKSSFVKLPKHLEMFEGLIDEKEMKAAAKRPKWETFIDFVVDKDFETIFITELTRCKIQESRIRMDEVMHTLWMKFALQFFNDIFSTGLKVDVEIDTFVEPQIDLVIKNPDGKRALNKAFSQDLLPPSRKNPQQIDVLCKKIMELSIEPPQIYYMKIHLNVKYPFWEKRNALAKNIIEDIKVPKLYVETVHLNENAGKKKNRNKEQTQIVAKISNFNCMNPISVEEQVSEIIISEHKKLEETFTPFTFDVLVKLDMTTTNLRPVLALILDEGSRLNNNSTIRAFKMVTDIILEAFPAYVTYHLASWLEMDPVEPESNVQSPSGSDKAQKGQGVNENDDNKKEEIPMKRQGRSKSDEDLLIPSDSSEDEDEMSEVDDEMTEVDDDE